VTRKWDSARAQKWDLSAVRALANAAEPIAYQTMENFQAKMKQDVPSFQVNDVIMPAYGMAGKFNHGLVFILNVCFLILSLSFYI
jgi:acyl-CoA synthetase (AMP-forming)/AMP-acid ligase II